MKQPRLLMTRLLTLVCLVSGGLCSAAEIDFAADVLPIFRAHCYQCHGPAVQESNYRLDVRESAFNLADLGVLAIVKGNSKASSLVQFVTGTHEDDIVMPPEDEGERLSSAEISTIEQWIDQGAVWPDEVAGQADTKITTDHWAFQPIQDVAPPSPTNDFSGTPIDAFIVAKLSEANLEMSQPADRVTWIRRIYLDMHGLPPSEAQVKDFVDDPSPDAHARVIDAVLDSPHYGERWARHWLDVARFGESTGFEVNRDRENAYFFRDYVIDALNSDKSYRDFIIDQLAGDVAGDEIGTGFLVGGPYDLVKSPNLDLTLMQRQDELADYVNTTSTAFLGLTVGCARCHNHKFDPILQKDYYAMQAVFAGVQHGERELRGELADEILDQIKQAQGELPSLETEFGRFKDLAEKTPEQPSDASLLPAVNMKLNIEDFAPVAAKFVRFTVNATTGAEPCIDELEVFANDDNQNVALSENGAIATASGTLPGYDIHQLEHINDGKYGNSHSWISNTSGGGWVRIELPEVTTIQRIQWGRDRVGESSDRLATEYVVEVSLDAAQWNEVASSARRVKYQGSTTVAEDAFIARLPADEAVAARAAFAALQATRARITKLRRQIPKAYVGTFQNPETIHRLHRGDPMSPREPVAPDALSVIGSLQLSEEVAESERRLALAKWIASPDNPLTSRVIVNRVWQHHFGTGLVSTPSDLGKNGTLPSHPELLDWMASQFMNNDWSLKWLHRQILSSQTYGQSSKPRPDAIAKDAASRLLWRFPPRRLEAEAIRDCVLQVSGALNPKAGGPGFLLFEVDHENVHHYFPKENFGAEEFRRMIYMTKIRQEQDEVFGVFDCPDGGQVIPNRSRSTTPLQALNLLNSKFMLEQAKRFADRVRDSSGPSVSEQVERAFQLAFSRSADDEERVIAVKLVNEHGLDAMCRAIFNSNEFLFLG